MSVRYTVAARELAVTADDPLILSEILRHLGIAEHGAGNLDAARALLEESTDLRRAVVYYRAQPRT